MEYHAHHFGASFYARLGFLSLCGTVLMIYSITQLTKTRGSFLVWQDRNMMLFRKPLPLRRLALAGSGFLFLLFINNMAVSAAEGRNPLPAYVMCIVSLWLPLLALYEAGPDDLRLDGGQRTYERRFGWPWKPKTSYGTFDDIKGVRISPQNTVYIHLKETEAVRAGIAVGRHGITAAAEKLVEELKREYGFAVMPYPRG